MPVSIALSTVTAFAGSLGAARSDLDAVEAIVLSAGTSFFHGMRVLPPDKYEAVIALMKQAQRPNDPYASLLS